MGYHQYKTTLDWSIIKMKYTESFDTKDWKCEDHHQLFGEDGSYEPEIIEDDEQNCNYIVKKDSKIFKQEVKKVVKPAG